ncbi:hypothetical protein LTR95_002818 [Oleoguttula sp. CCFEE 5521]
MARKSMRLSASTPASTGHKRAVSATVEAPLTVKKAKTGRSTKGEATEAEDVDQDAETSLSEPEDELSDFAAEAESAEDDDEVKDEESEDDYDSEEDAKPRRKPTHAKGKELWREGVKAGLGPGKQLIIKRPKARPAGKVPYADGRIHPNTLLFLEELKANNDREWLKNISMFGLCKSRYSRCNVTLSTNSMQALFGQIEGVEAYTHEVSRQDSGDTFDPVAERKQHCD